MNHPPRRRQSTAEWFTLAASMLIVGALVAAAFVEEARRVDEGAPGVAVFFDPGESTHRDDGFYVSYSVRNTGNTGIVAAEIWIEVFDGDELVESAEITVESIPLQGTQDGIYFSQFDPGLYTFRGRLESLLLP